MLAYQSNITITLCTFSYNRAHYGGVMFTIESSVTIDNTKFSNNTVEEDVNGVDSDTFEIYYSGGVVFSIGGSLTVTSSIFTNNAAAIGGVMVTQDGLVKIMNSTYTKNAAIQRGGVVFTDGGTFTIMSSIFTNLTTPQPLVESWTQVRD